MVKLYKSRRAVQLAKMNRGEIIVMQTHPSIDGRMISFFIFWRISTMGL